MSHVWQNFITAAVSVPAVGIYLTSLIFSGIVPSAVLQQMLLARCLDVFVDDLFLCRFVSKTKAKENLQCCEEAFFVILINIKEATSHWFDTFQSFNTSLNERKVSSA